MSKQETLYRYDGNNVVTIFEVEKIEDLNFFKILEEVSFPELKPKSDLVEIGELVKVFLPGESPWVIVRQVGENNLFLGEINNYLVNSDEHGYICGDLITFHLVDYGFVKSWEPSPNRKIDITLKVAP